jgi:uncharacterized membrane protein YraQ (UPF0718 family)
MVAVGELGENHYDKACLFPGSRLLLTVGLIYLLSILFAYLLTFWRSPEKARQGLKIARFSLLRVMPLLAAVFLLIGLFEVYLPSVLIERWLGAASGLTALLCGGAAGAVAIGPPLAAFPLAGSLLHAGAWPPAVAAFIVSWISVGVVTLPFEASVFGARFALLRNGLGFIVALLIGFLVGSLL